MALRFLHRVFPTREEYILTTVLSQRTTSNGQVIPFRDARGICKSAILLLSEGHLCEAETTATYTLTKGRSSRTWRWLFNYRPLINLRGLNAGNKGLIELFEEIRKGEAKLRLRPSDKRVWRLADRIRIFICDPSGKRWLVEIGRQYYDAKPKYRRKRYAVSGSIQNLELSRIAVAAQREVEQELGLTFPLEAFKLQPLSTVPHINDEHESDAYKGLLSINKDYDVVLVVDPWPNAWRYRAPTIRDTRVTVFTEVEEREVKPPDRLSGEVRITKAEAAALDLPSLMKIDLE